MAIIRANVERLLAALSIKGMEIMEGPGYDRPDRLFAWDRNRELVVECLIHRTHWRLDGWDPLHGKAMRESFREKTKPSMQVCFHEISAASPSRQDLYFVEIDFDEAPPSNPVNIFIHGKEVLVNAVTHGTTDQADISRRLDARFKPKETSSVAQS